MSREDDFRDEFRGSGKASRLKKRLVSFKLPKGVTPRGHHSDVLYRNGVKSGYLTSVGYSHTLDCPIGLGFVDLTERNKDIIKFKSVPKWIRGEYDETPAVYEVDLVHKRKVQRVKAEVSFAPLVDPKGRRVQGEYPGGVEM